MLGAAGVGGEVGQVDVGLGGRGQLDLGLLGGLPDALQGHLVLGEVDAGVCLEVLDDVLLKQHVDIFAAAGGVAVGGLDLEHAVADLQNTDVEGAAAQVVDRDDLAVGLVHAVGQRRRRGLVDDPLHVQPADLAGILGGLSLRVVEVGRHRDHRLLHGLAQIRLRGLLHLLQHHAAHLRRRVGVVLDLHPAVPVRVLHHLVRQVLDVLLHRRVVVLPELHPHLPISRFVANTVFSGLVTAYLFAGIPTSFCPSAVNATIDGVVLNPSWFSITFATLPSITATQELVVPRSIPII